MIELLFCVYLNNLIMIYLYMNVHYINNNTQVNIYINYCNNNNNYHNL